MEGILALMIPIIALSIPIVAIWASHKRKLVQMQIDAAARAGTDTTGQNARYTRELEERVRVLERIVTDKGSDLASQIEALRDTSKVEQLADARQKESL